MAVAERIFAVARSEPRRLAVIENGRRLGYGDFAARIAGARRLLADSLPVDRPALLCIGSVIDAWIVGLAARSLGVTTVQCRASEDIAQLQLGPASVLRTDREIDGWAGLGQAAERTASRVIVVSTDRPFGPEAGHWVEAAEPGGQVLLTSGTTGARKKVLINTANEEANAALRAPILEVTRDSLLNLFDFGGWTAMGYQWPVCAWRLGAGVILRHALGGGATFATRGMTHAFANPQLVAGLLATPGDTPLYNPSATLIVGGGALPLATWREARERLTPHVQTIIGSTEVGTFAVTPIEVADDLAWHRLRPEFEVQVVDDADRPAPVGQSGAVRVRTTGVDGYLGDPDASRQFFRLGYFYPGDLGALRADGRLSLQGRSTDVINVMGHKLATAPIEAILQDRLGAAGVCVFSTPAGEGDGEAVHVAIQPARPIGGGELTAALREALREALPYIAGVSVHRVQAFPRNDMGKVERAVLTRQVLGIAPRA